MSMNNSILEAVIRMDMFCMGKPGCKHTIIPSALDQAKKKNEAPLDELV